MTPVCPYCRTAIDDPENRHDCSGCGTPHHADCYAENGGCTVFGCSQAPADEPKLTITAPEITQPVALPAAANNSVQSGAAQTESVGWRPPSVLGIGAPLAALPEANSAPPGMESPPPPPPASDTTTVAPPPLPPGVAPMPLPATFTPPRPASLADMYSGYHPPKSRVTYILLGIFLGALGVHNFYAGYARKAAAQLCISVFTCFYASFVSWIWAVVEVCTVTEDSEGVQFS